MLFPGILSHLHEDGTVNILFEDKVTQRSWTLLTKGHLGTASTDTEHQGI